MSELKNCPFCGSEASLCKADVEEQSMYFVLCDECGVITPCFEDETEATAVWNNRVTE